MADIKLPRLPDRTPVKLTILLSPQLHADLGRYSEAYEAAYGKQEGIAELIPFMLASFLESDPAFRRARKGRGGD
ncbi:transposase [Tardibacter chloracetimidivorans]|uniref:Transposase n=1 Tax=Tardibacter chloracetimidivorans TaxID=1921510 RepID=A0A1L3ZVP1_9SPHN|nr:DUF2274 domain-containing protein [Tardibacter chloracetimidivorans]API59649.1 transposase [Tardibacter chloracetimidivorans]